MKATLALFIVGAMAMSDCTGQDFSWCDAASRPHPHVYHSAEDFALAASQARSDPRLGELLDEFGSRAAELLGGQPPVFDASWWEPIAAAAWEDTYQQVFENTWVLPGKAADAALTLARAHAFTGGRQYAEAAQRWLSALADYPTVAEHYDVGMNYTIWLVKVLAAYDILFDRLPEEDRVRLDGLVTRLHAAIRANDDYWIAEGIGGGLNNHLCWHKTASACVGAFYNRPELLALAVDGPRGFAEMIRDALVDDGLWPESSLNYHFAGVDAMLVTAVAHQRFDGRPLISERFGDHSLLDSYRAILSISFPDGTLPGVGDTYGKRLPIWNRSVFETVYRLTLDPVIAWALERAEPSFDTLFRPGPFVSAKEPRGGSRAWPEHGYVRLYSGPDDAYWSGDGLTAFVSFDRDGVHARRSPLGLILYGGGRVLVENCEARTVSGHSFSSDIQRGLNRTVLCANTIMVDSSDPQLVGDTLEMTHFGFSGVPKVVMVADPDARAYPGVELSRTVAVYPAFVLDVFQFRSGEAHTYDYLAHGPGPSAELSWNLPPAVPPADMHPASSWLSNVYGGEVAEGAEFTWTWDGGVLRMTPLRAGKLAWRAGFPESNEEGAAATPMVALRGRSLGGAGMFAVVYQVGERHLPSVRMLSLRPFRFQVGEEIYRFDVSDIIAAAGE